MNLKTITIVMSVLVVALLVMLFMQKGSYVSQAEKHYTEATTKSFKGTNKILEYMGMSVETNKLVWALTNDALQKVKTTQDMAKLEAKYFPTTKGNMSITNMTRTFNASSSFTIVSSFEKVVLDKKTQVKSLSGLKAIDVSSLLGKAAPVAAVEEEEEEAAEE